MSKAHRHLVVDGSNIATEGRSLPSLHQLDEAVKAIASERSIDSITVIVDATFAHRIADSEKDVYEDAVNAGEIITPPAGVVGRGDAFILMVADKANAVVLSNDSFQEFHGEHDWLFEEGRLVGGKPIEHVGWVFVDRVPVRGPASRRAIREAKDGSSKRQASGRSRGRSSSKPAPAEPLGAPKKPPPTSAVAKPDPPAKKSKPRAQAKQQTKRRSEPEALNEPMTFLSFVTNYSIGSDVEGVVERFSSHGCYVRAASAQCYLPSKSMGDPPPTRARDVVSQQQSVTVRVVSLDAERRGINVELVDVGSVVGEGASHQPNQPNARSASVDDSVGEAHHTRSRTQVATKKASKKAAPKKAPAKKAATATSSARATKAAAKKAPAKKKAAKKK